MHQSKKKALISLKKAKTSLWKIIEMVEKNEYCWDIMVQNLAVIWLLKSSNSKLFETFLDNYKDYITDEDDANAEIIKLIQLIQK